MKNNISIWAARTLKTIYADRTVVIIEFYINRVDTAAHHREMHCKISQNKK